MNPKQLDLIERAGLVFMKLGVRSVTMDDIANHLGISKKTLYNHFNDKSHLVREIISLRIEKDQSIVKSFAENSTNAIDELLQMSKFVIGTLSSINPTVFHDLKKSHPDAWQITVKHRWDFVYNQFIINLQRGIKEGLYRKDIHQEIYARLHVVNVDAIIEGTVFPWPEFKFESVFLETCRIHIRAIANEKGLEYFKTHLLNTDK
ncbi:MAG: TetR/AcrR family transcriptional regulator [Crocinitomicaceae bacterium]